LALRFAFRSFLGAALLEISQRIFTDMMFATHFCKFKLMLTLFKALTLLLCHCVITVVTAESLFKVRVLTIFR
jgi:hypothetical protein